MVDLNELNEGECEILALLAEGHTVKSIADVTGRTVAAVNERLRSARRKTGIGSSRELARTFAQQRPPTKIGLETSATVDLNEGPVSGKPVRSLWKGGFAAMILLIAAAGLALALQQPPTPDLPDPMIGSTLDEREPRDVLAQLRREQDPDKTLAPEGMNAVLRRLHSKVRTEARDDAWSPKMETALRSFFLKVPSVRPDYLRVICSATLCEVTANLPNRQSAAGELYLPEFQDPKQEAALQKLGLEPLPKVLGRTSQGPLYLSYWGRHVAAHKSVQR